MDPTQTHSTWSGWGITGAVASIIAAAGWLGRLIGGWFARANYRTRLDTLFLSHIETTSPLIAQFQEVKQMVAVNQTQIAALIEAQEKSNEKIDLLIERLIEHA